MGRLLFIVIIVVLLYWLFTSYRRQLPKQDEPPTKTQDMVSCAYCGIHLPKSESRLADGKYYCCEAHSRGQSEK